MRVKPLPVLLLTAAAAVIADQVTKTIVRAQLPLHRLVWLVPGWLALDHVQNQGAAFSMLQGQRWFFIGVAVFVLAAIAWVWWRYRPASMWVAVALGLVAGGSMGNLIDRAGAGTVTDFIDPRVFPVFNVADSCITVGVCILVVWLLWGQPGAEAPPAPDAPGAGMAPAPPAGPDDAADTASPTQDRAADTASPAEAASPRGSTGQAPPSGGTRRD